MVAASGAARVSTSRRAVLQNVDFSCELRGDAMRFCVLFVFLATVSENIAQTKKRRGGPSRSTELRGARRVGDSGLFALCF